MIAPPSVVVVGCGVAGTAAAWAAAAAGASVTLFGDVDGAARLLSGALDLESPELDARASLAIDPDVVGFAQALGIWTVDDRPARVASPWATVRTALGRDRAVLDLAPLRDARVAVLRADRPDWDADLLARAWRDDPWCKQHLVRFEPVSVEVLEQEHERCLSDAELAAVLDDTARQERLARRLDDRLTGFDAVLTGPWLGIERQVAHALSTSIRRPVGEALSVLASSAGWRFVRARDLLLSTIGVAVRRLPVREVVVTGTRLSVHTDDSHDVDADAVVLAIGGIAGGGFVYDPFEADPAPEMPGAPRPPFVASVRSPAALVFEGRAVGVLGSMFGTDLERFTWPAVPEAPWPLDTVSFHHRDQVCVDRDGRTLQRVLVAGKAASQRPVGALGAVASGLRAGRAAAALRAAR